MRHGNVEHLHTEGMVYDTKALQVKNPYTYYSRYVSTQLQTFTPAVSPLFISFVQNFVIFRFYYSKY